MSGMDEDTEALAEPVGALAAKYHEEPWFGHSTVAEGCLACRDILDTLAPFLVDAAHDARVRAEALAGLADTLEAGHSDLPDVMGVVRWMRARAAMEAKE